MDVSKAIGDGDAVLVERVREAVALLGGDRIACARVALRALDRVVGLLAPGGEDLAIGADALQAKRHAVSRWITDPTAERQVDAQHLVDPTRQLHAWTDFVDAPDAWLLETADFALHTVWSGTARWYVTPPSAEICAELAAICAARALVATGREPAEAALEIGDAVSARLAPE